MKFKIFILTIILFICITSCFKNSNDEESYIDDKNNQQYSNFSNNIVLDIPYKKLETFIGKKFIPVYSQKANLDSDIEDEVIIAYKLNNAGNINIIIFDLMQNGIIKKKFEIETQIVKSDTFGILCHNLLTDNDLAIIIEGKSNDNKSLLYIYQYTNETYNKIGDFKGDYSIIVDYTEIETESGKKIRLKEITTIDNPQNAANSNIQQKNVFVWDYANNQFVLAESSQIMSNDKTLSNSYLTDGDKFLKYVKGFWYPERYATLLKSQNFDPEKFNSDNIEYILFSDKDMEVTIKHDDYMNNYKIKKSNLIWGQLPGVRLSIQGISNTSQFSTTTLDVVLTGANSMQISTQSKFDETSYVRLDKPFIDYINDKINEKNSSEIKKIISFITDEYILTGNKTGSVILNFLSNNEFNIQKDQKIEKGFYKITKEKTGFIITFLFDTDNTILKDNNFLIKIFEDSQSFTISPVVMKINGFINEEPKNLFNFKKRNSG